MTQCETHSSCCGNRRWGKLIIAGIIFCTAWLLVQIFVGNRDHAAMTGWTEDWKGAEQEAATTGKPRLVMFTADWCGYCQDLKREALLRPDVAKYLEEKFVRVKVDCTEMTAEKTELSRKLEIEGFPTLVVLDAKGEVKARVVGSMKKGEFMDWAKQTGG